MKRLSIAALIIVFAFLLVNIGLAADGGGGPGNDGGGHPGGLPNPLGVGSIADLLKNVLEWLSKTIAPLIFTGMVLIGAYQILFAAGDPTKAKTGKNTILYAVIGYAIILIGWGIASIIQDLLS